MIITSWRHPDIEQSQDTSLTQQANAAATTLNVINTKGIAVNTLLLIGTYGSEDAEIVKTHASTVPTDTLITLAAGLKFDHSTDTPVTVLDYDQIEISRAASQGGSYSVLTTVAITVEEDATTYKDSAGNATDFYKIRYKNSIDSSFSGYSAEVPATGYGDTTLAGLVDSVYKLFSKQSSKILDRKEVIKWLNEGYITKMVRRIISLGIDYYGKYGTDGSGAAIAFVASQRAYSLPSNFVRPTRWDFSYNGVDYYPADPIDSTFDHPQAVYSQSSPKYYYEGNKIVPLPKPTATSGGMRPRFAALAARLANDDDVPDLPYGYEQTMVNWALKRAFESDNKFDVANYYGTLFENDVEEMLLEIKNRYPEIPRTVPMFGASIEDELYDGFNPPGV